MIKSTFNIVLNQLYPVKKRTFAYGILAILGTFFIMADQQSSPHKLRVISPQKGHYQVVIFDLGDVIFETSKSMQRAIIGPTILKNPSLIYHLFIRKIDIKEAFFDILRQIPAKTTDLIYNKGKAMPQILNDWQTGRSTLTELKLLACNQIHKSNHPTALKNLFFNVAYFMFDEECIAKSMVPVEPMVRLLKELKQSGYKIYVLSNWDPYSSAGIQKKYTELFSHCDGVMTSGQEGITKPNPAFYQRLLTKYSLNPQDCTFIDDEPFNIEAARKLGINGILHTHPTSTFKELIQCRILELTA